MQNLESLTMKKMKNPVIVTAILLIISSHAYSQKNKDALYLKNGSQIYGKMEQVSGNKLSVRTSDGSLFVFDSTEVDHYVIYDKATVTRKVQGFGAGTEIGFLAGPQNSQYPAPFSFGLSGSYTFRTRYMVEAGSGLEFIGHSYAPLYAGFRFYLRESRNAPFLFGRAGYMAMISENEDEMIYYPMWSSIYPVQYWYTEDREYKGGPTATVGLGASFSTGDMETFMSFAYRYFRTKEIVSTSLDTTEEFFYYYNRLEIKLGFRF
jgi:hypothetical protein